MSSGVLFTMSIVAGILSFWVPDLFTAGFVLLSMGLASEV